LNPSPQEEEQRIFYGPHIFIFYYGEKLTSILELWKKKKNHKYLSRYVDLIALLVLIIYPWSFLVSVATF
jgi:hypothetical protein